ncbi:MAG: OsmC family protein [Halioglobus sp.]
MQDLPHLYSVHATAAQDGYVSVKADDLSEIVTAPPAEFGGPGDKWSPESLLVASIADCFILTFRAVSRASKLDWANITCTAEGKLERIERNTQFTQITVKVTLIVPEGTDTEKAERLLHKSEEACLITNSLKASSHLEAIVQIA